MKYATPAAFRTALEARLNQQHGDGAGISRLRKRVVFERLLARLQAVAPDGWYLKGGFALELRLGAIARTTKDIDIDWDMGEDEAIELLLDAAAHELGDGFTFDVRREPGTDDLAGGGMRWTVRADLAGREFERVAIDVGFAKPPVVEPEAIVSPGVLEFAGIPPVNVPALAIEQHLAEKLHAYTRTYADGASSRVKDLVDVVIVARTTEVDATRLHAAVRSIFDRRATHQVPRALAPPPSDWRRPWAQLAENVPADAELDAGFTVAAALWDPILTGDVQAATWNSMALVWRAK